MFDFVNSNAKRVVKRLCELLRHFFVLIVLYRNNEEVDTDSVLSKSRNCTVFCGIRSQKRTLLGQEKRCYLLCVSDVQLAGKFFMSYNRINLFNLFNR